MVELSLIKTRDHPDISVGDGLPIEVVVGISEPVSPTIEEYGYLFSGHETEETITMPDDIANRLIEFYFRTHVTRPEERPNFNCHSFIAYTFGAVATPQAISILECKMSTYQIPPNKLLGSNPYAVVDSLGVHNHSTMGIQRPEYSIGVLGTNNPLTICANGLLQYWYGSGRFLHIEHIPSQ